MTPRRRPSNGTASGFAVAYRRVSTDDQATSGLGLDAQTVAIDQAAHRLDVTLRGTYTDAGVSGALPLDKRPQLLAAITSLKRGDVLLVAKRDRLGRDVIIAAMIESATKRRGARIVSAAGEGTDSDSPSDRLMRTLIDAFATYERLVIGARTAAALDVKRKRGERISRHAPYGYQFTETTPATLVEAPHEQAVLAIMRECREATYSFEGIARELNRLKHTARNGQPWRWQYVRGALLRHESAETPGE